MESDRRVVVEEWFSYCVSQGLSRSTWSRNPTRSFDISRTSSFLLPNVPFPTTSERWGSPVPRLPEGRGLRIRTKDVPRLRQDS